MSTSWLGVCGSKKLLSAATEERTTIFRPLRILGSCTYNYTTNRYYNHHSIYVTDFLQGSNLEQEQHRGGWSARAKNRNSTGSSSATPESKNDMSVDIDTSGYASAKEESAAEGEEGQQQDGVASVHGGDPTTRNAGIVDDAATAGGFISAVEENDLSAITEDSAVLVEAQLNGKNGHDSIASFIQKLEDDVVQETQVAIDNAGTVANSLAVHSTALVTTASSQKQENQKPAARTSKRKLSARRKGVPRQLMIESGDRSTGAAVGNTSTALALVVPEEGVLGPPDSPDNDSEAEYEANLLPPTKAYRLPDDVESL